MTEPSGAISVVIPALNAEARLAACLDALVAAAVDGLVREVVVVDGGSTDDTLRIADGFGARIVKAPPGRGGQLRAGGAAARSEWLLFLHADTVLEDGWTDEVRHFIEKNACDAGVFTLAFDAKGLAPRAVAAGAMMRTRFVKSPYGDQGLLISRKAYDEIGGFRDMPLFEDVDIVKRLLRRHTNMAFHVFTTKAVTSAERYEREGYAKRVFKNFVLFTRYQLGAAPEKLVKGYH
ncbi:MAG: TIGR04283 family arsenosugar biosynthesis glycosyltransferase [Pseudomonadota bacterium]